MLFRYFSFRECICPFDCLLNLLHVESDVHSSKDGTNIIKWFYKLGGCAIWNTNIKIQEQDLTSQFQAPELEAGWLYPQQSPLSRHQQYRQVHHQASSPLLNQSSRQVHHQLSRRFCLLHWQSQLHWPSCPFKSTHFFKEGKQHQPITTFQSFWLT